jgi:hypothetical protein
MQSEFGQFYLCPFARSFFEGLSNAHCYNKKRLEELALLTAVLVHWTEWPGEHQLLTFE